MAENIPIHCYLWDYWRQGDIFYAILEIEEINELIFIERKILE
jgi:hypothetical protein